MSLSDIIRIMSTNIGEKVKKIKIMSLWTNQTKTGETYFSGNLGRGTKVMVFKNGFKKKETEPDFNVFFVEEEKKEGPVPEKAQEESFIPF